MSTATRHPGNAAPGRAGRTCGTALGPRSSGSIGPRCALRNALEPAPSAGPGEVTEDGTARPFGEYQIHAEIGRARCLATAALADDLQRWLDHEPILARPAPWTERVGKWVRRRPAWAGLIATAVLSLAAMGVGSALFTVQVMKARTALELANQKLSHSLFVREWREAETLAAQDKVAGALAWFARALRQSPDDTALATRLLSRLSEHAFPLPHRASLTNDANLKTIGLSANDQRLVLLQG